MENLTTTPEDAVGIAGFLLSGDQKVFTCRGCGSEYLAESPAAGGCPICPLVAELAAVRDEVERVQAYRVIEAPSLEDLEVALNSNAAAGYRAVRVDPPISCGYCDGAVTGHVAILALMDYNRDDHVTLLEWGDALQERIESARLIVPEAMKGAS